jgi:protein-S-isoprenylcysteine O-methyltransferase Ste14
LLVLVGIACLTFQLARLLPDYDLFADSVLVAHLGRRKTLRENLGPEYVRYSERTKRLIPGKF